MKFTILLLAGSVLAAPTAPSTANQKTPKPFTDQQLAALRVLADNKPKLGLNEQESQAFDTFMSSIKPATERRQLEAVAGLVGGLTGAGGAPLAGLLGGAGGVLGGITP